MTAAACPLTVVVGLGRSGRGAAMLLHRLGEPVLVLDSGQSPDLEEHARLLRAEGIAVRLGCPLTSATFDDIQAPLGKVIVSPGIRWDHPVLEQLRQDGVSIQGEMVPAWMATAAVPWIGITGTNGKTTVTQLVHHLLTQAGLDAPQCGNVGFSAAEVALERCAGGASTPPDWLVVELSSYQIEAAPQLAPRIGLWTTLTPDHLERHGTLDNYRAIKRSLLERSQLPILNADDPDLRAHAPSWDRGHWVTAGPRHELPADLAASLWIEGGMVCNASGPLLAADSLAMPGAHNRQNLVLATAVGLEVGLSGSVMEAAFRTFPGVPHRLERVREQGGVTYYNDSKATNYDAAEVGLRALEGPLVVLAGGQSKIGEAGGWIAELRRQAFAVVLYGAARPEFRQLLEAAGYGGELHEQEGLEQAVPLAAELARRGGCRAVLLSPACASFDQYSDFEARGDHFRRCVEAL
ncbi:UDP-N-acetylmuramoyl-L-alanine--D-glutamate ligase [Synechococcus sp. CCY9202]|uniref:UDP-N-acetylmuramoyl-L-alanine--D-glutamate ligase n=1 Tax=Synechococcus sp. CCY9202 TaxID=174698 RepID=UPI002B1FBA9F|nr:UDP-N-acetylmuramoyl-L-alanine--D-glutamate ligase [Synechococcus sp. CCY9202]MEA5421607.1 UDP-N-acetylmuramoyl-L-alanine--D-glutamate ligase [Synechococcus sp. CCY9202]